MHKDVPKLALTLERPVSLSTLLVAIGILKTIESDSKLCLFFLSTSYGPLFDKQCLLFQKFKSFRVSLFSEAITIVCSPSRALKLSKRFKFTLYKIRCFNLVLSEHLRLSG